MKKYLRFKNDKSDKFWSIEVTDNYFHVSFGKTGTDGIIQAKSFESEHLSMKEAKKLINEKIKKGYVESADLTPSGELPDVSVIATDPIPEIL